MTIEPESTRELAQMIATQTGYRCQWCEQPCTIEENQAGSCDECAAVWDEQVSTLRRLLRESGAERRAA